MRRQAFVLRFMMSPLVSDMRVDERMIEHRVQCRRDVRRRVRGIEKARRRAALQTCWNVRYVVVGVIVLVTGEAGIHGRDLLVGYVEHRHDDAASFERRAVSCGIDHGGMVAAGPAAVGNAFYLWVLRTVGDEENIRERVIIGTAVTYAGD